jgi:hypothetical protein
MGAVVRETDFTDATLRNCKVHGISVWDIEGEPNVQENLVISRSDEPEIVVDDLEAAQFMYLLRENKKVREVLTAVSSRLVLILGRFGERKTNFLEPICDALKQGTEYLPLILDFEPPEGRDVLHTVQTYALLSRFVLVDLAEPRSAPFELSQIVSLMRPVQPLLPASEKEPVALGDLRRRYHWLLEPHYYETIETLLQSLKGELIARIEVKVAELDSKRLPSGKSATTARNAKGIFEP